MSVLTDFLKTAAKNMGLNAGNLHMSEQFNDGKFRFGAYLANQDGRMVKIRKGAI